MKGHTTNKQPQARRARVGRPSAREAGQTGLAMVLMIAVILVTGAGILATNITEHDPLVQGFVVQHYAYRAVEAGMNSYVADVNQDSNVINCTSASQPVGQCQNTLYDSWIPVPGTTQGGQVPQYYLWENPQFCFTETCPLGQTGTNILYVRETIVGAAGLSPSTMVYQTQYVDLNPVNGFLNRVWWSNYEAEPNTGSNGTCEWDWDNNYNGPGSSCAAVYFGPGDQVYGPIYSNDSIYVSGNPSLGPIDTADPDCLVTTGTGGTADCVANATTANQNNDITQSTADRDASSTDAAASQCPSHVNAITTPSGTTVDTCPLPPSATELKSLASVPGTGDGGCVYLGPTTIVLDPGDKMTVTSPDTPVGYLNNLGENVEDGGAGCAPTGIETGSESPIPVPNGINGNGIIYVDTATNTDSQTACTTSASNPPTGNGANPFDDWTGSANGASAQDNYKTKYASYAGATSNPDCEGDAFVTDSYNSTTGANTGGVNGTLTIAADNNIEITGDIEYLDCSGGYEPGSPNTNPCGYNVGGTNDALGLIANNFIGVNDPWNPDCTTTGGKNGTTTCTAADGNTANGSTELAPCTKSQMGTVAAALCDPVTPGASDQLIINAAVLALSESFTVNNYTLAPTGGNPSAKLPQGQLVLYGSLDQNYRGEVGTFGSQNGGPSEIETGYKKLYQWDSRLQAVTPPYYLNPGTPSFEVGSSASFLNLGSPAGSANCTTCTNAP